MKKISIVSSISVLTFIIVAFVSVTIHSQTASANPSSITRRSIADSLGLANPYAIASSSATFLSTAAASTTLVVDISSADQAEINEYLVGSTTSTVLLFSLDFSNDYNCTSSSATCNWYKEDANTVSNSVVTHSVSTYHTWSPSSAATSTKNIVVGSLGARFMRVSFQATGANGTFWAEVANKSQRSSI